MRQTARPTATQHKTDGLPAYPARQPRKVVAVRRGLPSCIRMPSAVLLDLALYPVFEILQSYDRSHVVMQRRRGLSLSSHQTLSPVIN